MAPETEHKCIHEDDFEEFTAQLKQGTKTFKYIKGELILIKDALGIKDKDNGARDKQIKDVINKTTQISKRTEEKDNNLNDKIVEIQIDMAKVKTALQIDSKTNDTRQKLVYTVLGGVLMFIVIEVIKYLTPL